MAHCAGQWEQLSVFVLLQYDRERKLILEQALDRIKRWRGPEALSAKMIVWTRQRTLRAEVFQVPRHVAQAMITNTQATGLICAKQTGLGKQQFHEPGNQRWPIRYW